MQMKCLIARLTFAAAIISNDSTLIQIRADNIFAFGHFATPRNNIDSLRFKIACTGKNEMLPSFGAYVPRTLLRRSPRRCENRKTPYFFINLHTFACTRIRFSFFSSILIRLAASFSASKHICTNDPHDARKATPTLTYSTHNERENKYADLKCVNATNKM